MVPIDPRLAGSPDEPFWHLLYRYWFWGWLFADASRGDLVRRVAAQRHNVAQRVHLPVYMRRWSTCIVALAAVGHGLDAAATPPVVTAAFFVSASVGAVIVVAAAAAWALLASR